MGDPQVAVRVADQPEPVSPDRRRGVDPDESGAIEGGEPSRTGPDRTWRGRVAPPRLGRPGCLGFPGSPARPGRPSAPAPPASPFGPCGPEGRPARRHPEPPRAARAPEGSDRLLAEVDLLQRAVLHLCAADRVPGQDAAHSRVGPVATAGHRDHEGRYGDGGADLVLNIALLLRWWVAFDTAGQGGDPGGAEPPPQRSQPPR